MYYSCNVFRCMNKVVPAHIDERSTGMMLMQKTDGCDIHPNNTILLRLSKANQVHLYAVRL